MKRKIINTADGSKTIFLEDWNEHYHSKHGAIQEAYHVFIHKGLHHITENKISILEIGFGTGLNAYISMLEASKLNRVIHYHGIEAFPVQQHEWEELNFTDGLPLNSKESKDLFKRMHTIPWEEEIAITPNFYLKKIQMKFEAILFKNMYNLIYFDAFGARVQPELWTIGIFQKMFNALKANGVLVTYSAKGSVRRAMQASGFEVERLEGPPGKREMLRATKRQSQ